MNNNNYFVNREFKFPSIGASDIANVINYKSDFSEKEVENFLLALNICVRTSTGILSGYPQYIEQGREPNNSRFFKINKDNKDVINFTEKGLQFVLSNINKLEYKEV